MDYFYDDWMKRNKYWFNKDENNDYYLSSTYGHLIDEYKYDNNPIIGILVYDQLTRHYYRNEQANHIIMYFNQKSLEIANLHKNKAFINNLKYNDWLFYMLVYRHTNERENLLFVMREAWNNRNNFNKSFIKATYTRANFPEEFDKNNYDNYNYDKRILDNNPENEMLNDYLYKIGDYSNIISLIEQNKLIIVSFSGGVDSISCLYYLSKLTKNLIAVHINYNNREETKEEVKFLFTICNKLKVKLLVRTINEIKRRPCIENDLRDVYESYTKRIRFNCYRKANENKNNNPIVVLGHNKDDCLENILTNMAYKNKYDNLKGIELESIIDGINFHRPLIKTTKEEIYKFANFHNLPYLKNSTPEWSQRGKIRSSVVPILNKWDNRIIEGLFGVSELLSDLYINIDIMIKKYEKENEINIEELNLSSLFWKHLIFKLCNYYPSNKSLKALIDRLIIIKRKFSKMEINKIEKIIIKKNINMTIWKSKKLKLNFMINDNNNNNDYNEVNENVN